MYQYLICRRCQKPLSAKKRADAVFCSDECRGVVIAAERRQRNQERNSYESSIPTRFAFWIREFEAKVRAHAPENAVGYQLGLWTGSYFLWLPVISEGKDRRGRTRTRLSFFRRRTADAFFPLDPFEPPTVPLATIYEIRFVGRLHPHHDLGDLGRFSDTIPYEMKQNNLPVDAVHRLPVSREKR